MNIYDQNKDSLGDDNSSTASGNSTPTTTPPLTSTQGPALPATYLSHLLLFPLFHFHISLLLFSFFPLRRLLQGK
jgi:hypothetical protein